MNDASVVKTVIDICSRSFTIVSDEGDIQVVYCETTQEFMDVLMCVKMFMDEDMIVYSGYCYLFQKKKKN